MKLRQLFESKSSTVGIIFGRFNPPHMGHMKAWEMASENDNWFVGTNQSTEGPKDPLPYDIKVKAMQAVWPEIKGHIVAETSWLTLASKIYKKYGSIVLNVYTDEDWVTKTLIQYNGKEGAHGFYNFKDIAQQVTPRLSSATALRNAVAADDRDLFGQAAGVDPNTLVAGHPFFDVVKYYLMPHAEKAAAKVSKKKVKQPEKDVVEVTFKKSPYGRTAASQQRAKELLRPPKPPESKKDEKDSLKEFSRGDNGDDEGGDDPYKYPEPEHFNRSIDFFGQFEAEHFDEEDMNDETGEFKGYWDYDGKLRQIAYFKFDNPRRTGSNHPGMGWYYEPQNEGVSENYWDRLQHERALESAGVGIITKQNTTVDVNKNTPKKNLKAFRLA
jgi:hypothetical protein